jgi:F-type H+-transporting ATPase subunit b
MHWDFSFGSPTIWVFLALIIVIAGLMSKGIHKMIAKALDSRADEIRNELDEAKRLREEAQALLASYQRKQAEAEEQAKDIVDQARKDAKAMAIQARKSLQEKLDRRAELAEAKIVSAEAEAMSDVKSRAVDLAIAAAEKLIREEFKAGDHSALVKDGISQLGKALH